MCIKSSAGFWPCSVRLSAVSEDHYSTDLEGFYRSAAVRANRLLRDCDWKGHYGDVGVDDETRTRTKSNQVGTEATSAGRRGARLSSANGTCENKGWVAKNKTRAKRTAKLFRDYGPNDGDSEVALSCSSDDDGDQDDTSSSAGRRRAPRRR
jgi:hypothetical protein